MPLFGPIHLTLLFFIAAIALALCRLCRLNRAAHLPVRLGFGICLFLNELFWWRFRYSHEGVRISNLPFQLCDLSMWSTVLACFFLRPLVTEFAYFAGIAGAGMALLTPDLWSPWPSYPAICFFVSHGGIVSANIALVYGQITVLRNNAVWRAFAMLLLSALCVGVFNWIFKTNYMYLCTKPQSATLLDSLGPWPTYLFVAFGLAFILYLMLDVLSRKLTKPVDYPHQRF